MTIIIGLLAGCVAPSPDRESEIKAARTHIDALEKAVEIYRMGRGKYPKTDQGLAAFMVAPPGATNWKGHYLKSAVTKPLPLFPAGRTWCFDIYSHGRDGKTGGQNEYAEVNNW